MAATALFPHHRESTRLGWASELVGGAAAVVAGLLTWALVVLLGGVQLTALMGSTPKQIGLLDIVLTAFGAGVLGLLALRVLRRFTDRALTIWTIVAAVVWAGSLAGAFFAVTPAAAWSLVALHTVVAGSVITVGRTFAR